MGASDWLEQPEGGGGSGSTAGLFAGEGGASVTTVGLSTGRCGGVVLTGDAEVGGVHVRHDGR